MLRQPLIKNQFADKDLSSVQMDSSPIIVVLLRMLDHFTGRSRGFGFVKFDNEEAVDKIFVDGQLHELGEAKEVEIKMAKLKRLLSISHTTTIHVVVVLSSHTLVDLVAVGVMAENQRGYNDYGFMTIMWEVMVVVLQ